MIKKYTPSSPFVLIIPLVVALVVIGIAVFVTSKNTELRSQASNARYKSVSICVRICEGSAGSRLSCKPACEALLKGSITCDDFSESVSPIHNNNVTFKRNVTNTCWNMISPIGRECRSKCANNTLRNSLGPTACQSTCQQVLSGKQTCAQVCANPINGVTKEACMSACNGLSVTPTPRPTVYVDPSKVNEIPDGEGTSRWYGSDGKSYMETICTEKNGVRSCRSTYHPN